MSGVSAIVAPVPTNNYAAYRECCAEQAALPPEEWAFKRDPRYRRILEHVTREQGLELLDVARDAAGDLWGAALDALPHLAAENDRYGAPLREVFPSVGLFCSPSNLRYFAHALAILRHLRAVGLDTADVVEIGGGYGGLALYLHRLAPLLAVTLRTYWILDVPEAVALQAAYSRALGVPYSALNGLALSEPLQANPRGYVISAFAFSEFAQDMRDWYVERVLRSCVHGFIVWNFVQPLAGVAEKVLGGPVYPFVEAPLTLTPERPSTGPGNVVVTW